MVVPDNQRWDFHGFNFGSDVASFEAKIAPLVNSDNADLSAFTRHGGKLLMWHGWTDTTLEPRSTVNYYNRVIAAMGKGRQAREALAETQKSVRLFMAPGVNHCGGGAGPDSSFAYTMARTAGPNDPDHDILAALDRWVERGVAPGRLISSHHVDGKADRTRLICAYPQVAHYTGKGDPNEPGSFVCADEWDDFARDFSAAGSSR